MSEKRSESLLTIHFPARDKARLKALAQREQRTISNLAGMLLRKAMEKRERAAA
ncbi:ribbon-helix-helix domain-containing protein [Propionivibrio sp.]|uniref:ribbon-helix-helix domain-containing protein n=1 Tax=Propionivibrio sp. TaxID=2212460 RepID=UPI0039E30D46